MADLEKFPRGTLPPSMFKEMVPGKPRSVQAPPSTIAAAPSAETPRGTCDLAMTCPNCATLMQPEHAHYRCGTCGYRDSCCF